MLLKSVVRPGALMLPQLPRIPQTAGAARGLHQSAPAQSKSLDALFDRLADPSKAPRDLRYVTRPGKRHVTVDTVPRSTASPPDGWARDPVSGKATRAPVERTPEEQAEYEKAKAHAAAHRPRPEHQVTGSGKLNPFLPSRTPEGYFRPPRLSAMHQARIIKLAYAEGWDDTLPPSPKKTKYQGRIDWWKEQKIREISEDPVQQAAFNTAFADAAKFLSPDQDTLFAFQCAKHMLEDQGAYKGRKNFWKGSGRVKRMFQRRAIIEQRLKMMPDLIKEYKEVRSVFPFPSTKFRLISTSLDSLPLSMATWCTDYLSLLNPWTRYYHY